MRWLRINGITRHGWDNGPVYPGRPQITGGAG